MNDLTVSNIERQNVLNNRYAVEALQENLGFTGMLFEGVFRFTKKMVADFYEVEERTIERILEEHGDELKYNGYILSRGKQLKEFKLQFAPVSLWLYDREHRHRIGHDGWTVADNLKWREEYAPPILERIKAEPDSVKANPAVPKDSDLMGAVTYALNEWEWVPGIFSGGDYDLDNNLIERMQRLVSLLRRNSLFFGSHKGGETAAMYLSLVVSCRLNGVDVMEYISDTLNRCCSWAPTTPLEKYRDMLPDRWKPQVNGNE